MDMSPQLFIFFLSVHISTQEILHVILKGGQLILQG